MGVLELLDDRDALELDVEVLVDALERAPDLDVVLELDRHLVVDEGLEEAGRRSAPACTGSDKVCFPGPAASRALTQG